MIQLQNPVIPHTQHNDCNTMHAYTHTSSLVTYCSLTFSLPLPPSTPTPYNHCSLHWPNSDQLQLVSACLTLSSLRNVIPFYCQRVSVQASVNNNCFYMWHKFLVYIYIVYHFNYCNSVCTHACATVHSVHAPCPHAYNVYSTCTYVQVDMDL